MRALIFGCPHLQAVTTLGSSALAATVAWLREQAEKLAVTHVICLGDTVDSVSKTDLMVNLQVKYMLDQFKTLAAMGVHVYWMIGNHDVYSDFYSAIDVFDQANNFTVVNQPVLYDHEESECILTFWPFRPWMDNPLDWAKHIDEMVQQRGNDPRPRLLFSHCPIEGMPLGGSKDKGADLVELALQYDRIFAGHYHISNQFDAQAMSAETGVTVPGCVLAHDFKDLGWFHGAVVYDYAPGASDQPNGVVTWLANPHSHYFYLGPSAEYQAAIQQPMIADLRARTHVRFTDKVDPAPYREWGVPTVQVRPKREKLQSSRQESFKLEGDPIGDLKKWLASCDVEASQDLLAVAREYLA